MRPAAWDEPKVGAAEVNIRHLDAAHGVDTGVGVAVNVNVVEDNIGVGTKHRVNGHTGLSRWVGDGDVRDRDVLQINVDEVHVGILNGQVLSVQSTSGGTWVVDDGTAPRLTVGVAVLDRPFLQGGHGVLWEVETCLVNTVDGEVFHGDNRSLAATVREHSTDVGEGDIAHGVVARVTVSSCTSTRWSRVVVSATRAEHSVGRVVEVHMVELVSVIGASCGRTVVGEGHTNPFTTVHAGDVDRVGAVALSRHLGTGTIEGNSLTGCNLDLNTRLDGQVRGDDEVIVGRVDADWAVGQVPHWVGRDVSRDIGTLAFVRHHAVVHGTILAGGGVAVVLVVTGPERSDGTWASQRASRIWESRLVVGPEVALNVCVAVADEVHRALSAELDTVVGVVTVVGRTEIIELEACWDVNVRVAASLVGVPVVGRDTVVEVRSAVGCARHRCVSVGDFHQSLVEGLPCVGGRTGRDTEVGGRWDVPWVGVETRRGRVRNAGTLLSRLVHVPD